MKLSEETLEILKNFSAINNGIYFEQGNTIKTVSPGKTILANAKVQENFPLDFGIYDLNKFLGAHSLFENPDIEFESNYLLMKQTEVSAKFLYCDSSLVVRPPDKKLELPSVDLSFSMSKSVYDSVVKAAMVLQVPEIAIVGDGSEVKFVAFDSKNNLTDTFNYKIAETDQNFTIVFKVENFSKLMSKDYNIFIALKGLAKFESTDGSLICHVAIETANSTIG